MEDAMNALESQGWEMLRRFAPMLQRGFSVCKRYLVWKASSAPSGKYTPEAFLGPSSRTFQLHQFISLFHPVYLDRDEPYKHGSM